MAQFRNTADILNEILQKAGEPTNGNSPYETLARTYANKVHHAIIGGGSIFNLTVDEPWVWARARSPIILELSPAYTSGAASCTVNDVNITFTLPPSDSLEGWHFQVNGTSTVYKITSHVAGAGAAVLDSSFVNDSGAFAFRAFRLDYDIFPAYMYVDNYSDRVDFQETASATLAATLTHGAYTPNGLAAHIASRMSATGANTYSGTFDTVTRQTFLTRTGTAAGTFFNLLAASGSNVLRTGLINAGYDRLDYTGATTYTSSYTPNSVARLIEPFKLFGTNQQLPFIYSSDPIRMQQDYPISLTRERTPSRFVRIAETAGGAITVRFNSYPKFKTKVSIDWIPVPIDLQDNTASVPLLPRGDIDVLIHGAAAYIAFDKEDSKWDGFLKLCSSGLDAMRNKNRALLMRTGEYFGQIIPRLDLTSPRRLLDYGYTAGGSAIGSTASSVDVLVAVTIPYTSFQVASTATTITARTLPASRSLYSIIAKHTQSFSGGAIASLSLDVGISGTQSYFIGGFNPAQAVSGTAQASFVGLYYPAAETPIQVSLTAVGANLSALTQGSLVLYFQESVVP